MPSVLVLIATYNGLRFLPQQLESIHGQSIGPIDLLISDDGSQDGTSTYLAAYRARWTRGRAVLTKGPGQLNPAANFRHLILGAYPEADFVAYSDQDDVWFPEKLEIATGHLAGAEGPALFCSRTALIDVDGKEIGMSALQARPPAFRNALVQSIAGGNTMVMNSAALRLMQEACRRTSFASHDWWTYQVVAGAGGKVIYSSNPTVFYRQHDENAVGANLGWRARFVRLKSLAKGRYRGWNDQNLAALDLCEDLLTPASRAAKEHFKRARRGPLWRRISSLIRSGVYRQGIGAHAMLFVAAAMRWL
ncbi:MAG: glycosyltransferase family 2 protein [Devosia sp.]